MPIPNSYVAKKVNCQPVIQEKSGIIFCDAYYLRFINRNSDVSMVVRNLIHENQEDWRAYFQDKSGKIFFKSYGEQWKPSFSILADNLLISLLNGDNLRKSLKDFVSSQYIDNGIIIHARDYYSGK